MNGVTRRRFETLALALNAVTLIKEVGHRSNAGVTLRPKPQSLTCSTVTEAGAVYFHQTFAPR